MVFVFAILEAFVVLTVSLLLCMYIKGWLGSRVVSVLDSGAEGPGFKSQSRRSRITVLGKVFTPIVPQATKVVAALLRVARVIAGLAESNSSLRVRL